MNNDVLKLVTSVGIPSVIQATGAGYDQNLMRLAILNKVQLIYALNTNSEADELIDKYNRTILAIREISDDFNASGIDYAVFKTIKPFMYNPSDIDVLISYEDRRLACDLLLRKGYTSEVKDATCITMRNEMDVDLYTEPSVSDIPYLRRDELMENSAYKEMNGTKVSVLSDLAEFIAVMSHSLYKEQMLTLNDYYTLTILAERLSVDNILKFAQDTNTVPVLRLITSICRNITEQIFGKNQNLNICRLAYELGAKSYSVKGMPCKFSMKLAMGLLFRKILSDPGESSSLLKGVASSISLRRARKFLDHMRRETY